MNFLLLCVFIYVLFGISYAFVDKDIIISIVIFIIAICLIIFGACRLAKSLESSEQPIQKAEVSETQQFEKETQKSEVSETQQSEKETRKTQERKLRKLVASGKADIFIDGEPTSDDFDLDGIRLKDYEIKFKNGKVYLISY